MTAPIGGAGATPGLDAQHAKLKQAAHALEGVFLNQLFEAMRATVPHDSGTDGAGGEMFQSMLDEKLAQSAAAKSVGGIGDALYRQLSRHLPPATSK